jgi:hypothetical protein
MRKKRVHIRDGFSLKSSTAVYGHTQYSPALPLPHPIVDITKRNTPATVCERGSFLAKALDRSSGKCRERYPESVYIFGLCYPCYVFVLVNRSHALSAPFKAIPFYFFSSVTAENYTHFFPSSYFSIHFQ